MLGNVLNTLNAKANIVCLHLSVWLLWLCYWKEDRCVCTATSNEHCGCAIGGAADNGAR